MTSCATAGESSKHVVVLIGGAGVGKSSYISGRLGRPAQRVSDRLDVDGTFRVEIVDSEWYIFIDTVGVDSTNAVNSFPQLREAVKKTKCTKFTPILLLKYGYDRISNLRDAVIDQLNNICSRENKIKVVVFWRGQCTDQELVTKKRSECNRVFPSFNLYL